MKKNKKTW